MFHVPSVTFIKLKTLSFFFFFYFHCKLMCLPAGSGCCDRRVFGSEGTSCRLRGAAGPHGGAAQVGEIREE